MCLLKFIAVFRLHRCAGEEGHERRYYSPQKDEWSKKPAEPSEFGVDGKDSIEEDEDGEFSKCDGDKVQCCVDGDALGRLVSGYRMYDPRFEICVP